MLCRRERNKSSNAIKNFHFVFFEYLPSREALREPVKNVLADLSAKGVPPPPTPLTENHYAKKLLAERGVPPPP